jgi:hypothetical protein
MGVALRLRPLVETVPCSDCLRTVGPGLPTAVTHLEDSLGPARTPSAGLTRSCDRRTPFALNWIVCAYVVQHPLTRNKDARLVRTLGNRFERPRLCLSTPYRFDPTVGLTRESVLPDPSGGSTEEDASHQPLQPNHLLRVPTDRSTLGRKLSHPDRPAAVNERTRTRNC